MHRGPDGDAIGSTLGLAHFLAKLNVKAHVVAPDDFPEFLKWMPGAEDIVVFEKDSPKAAELVKESDAILCLDFNHPSRMSALQDVVLHSDKPKFVIDHHQDPSDFAEEYFVDVNASSTAELVFRMIKEMGLTDLITQEAAICLYTGLVTDTGSFRFSSVTPEVLRIAAELIETGIDHTTVYNEVFDNSTYSRLKLIGYALNRKTFVIPEARTAYIALTAEELKEYDYQKGDTEGLVNYALGLKGIDVAGFFYEMDGFVKLSLRSKGRVHVNEVSSTYFNGGGHKMAAGGRTSASLDETIALFEKIAKSDFSLNL